MACSGLQIEVVPAPDENGAFKNVLQDLNEGVVARVKHGISRLFHSVLVDKLQADKGLAGSRDTRNQHQVALTVAFGLSGEGV